MDDQPNAAGERPMPAQLASRDSWFIFSAPPGEEQADVIAGVYVFDTRSDPNPVRTHAAVTEWMRARLGRAPVLCSRLVRVPGDIDHPYWVHTDDVDLEQHILVERIGDTSSSALSSRLVELALRQVPLNRPPWQLVVLTEVRGVAEVPDNATIIMLRMHHCAADGLSTVQIARALFDDPNARPARWGTPGPVRGVAGSLLRLPGQFVGLARALYTSAVARRELAGLVESGEVTAPLSRRPRTRFNGDQSGARVFGRATFALSDVREVAKATGTSINDVVLATVGGALAAYLADCGEAPAGSLAAQVPRSIRDSLDVAAANKISTMYVDLHTDERDPSERLRRIRDSADAEKHRVQQRPVVDIGAPLDHVPAVYLRLALALSQRQKAGAVSDTVPFANTLVSNVPRGAADLVFGASSVVDGFGIPAIHPGSALAHSVSSIGDVLNIGVVSDAAMMPDAGTYTRHLDSAFAELRAAAVERL